MSLILICTNNFQGDRDSQNKTLCSGKVHNSHRHQSCNLDCWSHHCSTHLQLMDLYYFVHQHQVGDIHILSNDFLQYMIHSNLRHQSCILGYLSHHHKTHHQSTIHVYNLELVSKELNQLAAILHVYAGGLIFMK